MTASKIDLTSAALGAAVATAVIGAAAAVKVLKGCARKTATPVPHVIVNERETWSPPAEAGPALELRPNYNPLLDPSVSTVLVGGTSGFGKTYAVQNWLKEVPADPQTKVVVIDGKAGHDWDGIQGVNLTADGNFESALLVVKGVHYAMTERLELGTANLPPAILVIDETSALTPFVGRAKDARRHLTVFWDRIEDLVRRGRAANIKVILMIQSPGEHWVSPGLRDSASVQVAFHLSSNSQIVSVLGVPPEHVFEAVHKAEKGEFVVHDGIDYFKSKVEEG
ncbi:hypothetical protein KIH27_15945 [Mycobacterium sp. M1]|uniref:FtsK domain-containing protein n=1 Tax=Mycolicibacter acidiphilus TaxID=2835306 RepID=A0ABS5RL92_9MYCO|nr:hypothetical protein [Mycolicibacter acidiphilus]MBS9535080.1 hypothetical protein [Mycolicibacter acidiphilus]